MLLVPLIEKWIEQHPDQLDITVKQDGPRDPKRLSISSLGHCARRLAYRHHGFVGRPLDARSLLTFADGDAHHELIRYYLKHALAADGHMELVDQERGVELVTEGGAKIPGSCDGILRRVGTGTEPDYEDALLEVKSMGSYGFELFQKTRTIEPDYQIQASGYAKPLGLKKIHFLLKNKNTGEMDEIELEPVDFSGRLRILDKVYASKSPEELVREYGADSRGRLDWHCGYCPFVLPCHGDKKLKEVSRNKFTVS